MIRHDKLYLCKLHLYKRFMEVTEAIRRKDVIQWKNVVIERIKKVKDLESISDEIL